jgi:predicted Kef-type K+ transport protein
VVESVVLLLALVAGLLAKQSKLPPLVGFLIAGFALAPAAQWMPELGKLNFGPMADLGVTLLLFSIGLKLDIRLLLRPYIWGVGSLHMLLSVALMTTLFIALKAAGISALASLSDVQFMTIGFALSFSSTVLAVKVLEERGEMVSLHGRIAIGILVLQDIIAVVYLTLMGDKALTWYAPSVLLLIFFRPFLHRLLLLCGHGELLVLAGFLFALGGYTLFDLVGLKGDLGALVVGALLAGHGKSAELSKTLLNFKDLLLIGFFLSIGQNGLPSSEGWLMVLIISLAITFKPVLFFLLFTRFKLRARTALFTSLTLNNYSEFGLIVLALAIKENVLPAEWLVIVALTLSLSFVIGSVLDGCGYWFYSLARRVLLKFQTTDRLAEQQPVDIGDAKILVMGMGRVGSGAYGYLRKHYGEVIVGFEEELSKVKAHCDAGRNVQVGDASDRELWERIPQQQVEQVILALSNHAETLRVAKLLRSRNYQGVVAAVAHYPDQVEELKALNVIAFNVYAEAGAGFAEHVHNQLEEGLAQS